MKTNTQRFVFLSDVPPRDEFEVLVWDALLLILPDDFEFVCTEEELQRTFQDKISTVLSHLSSRFPNKLLNQKFDIKRDGAEMVFFIGTKKDTKLFICSFDIVTEEED